MKINFTFFLNPFSISKLTYHINIIHFPKTRGLCKVITKIPKNTYTIWLGVGGLHKKTIVDKRKIKVNKIMTILDPSETPQILHFDFVNSCHLKKKGLIYTFGLHGKKME